MSFTATIRNCLEWTEKHLTKQGEEHPRLAAQWLLTAATGLTRLQLYLEYDRPLSVDERKTLRLGIRRRLRGEPLQYITGRAPFRHLELAVRPGVLIPRPETETLVDLVLAFAPQRVLDVGTGSGAIALSLLHELPGVSVWATDISAEALAIAAENARELGLGGEARDGGVVEDLADVSNGASDGDSARAFDEVSTLPYRCDFERLHFIEDDLAISLVDDPELYASFDALVSNPPYIPSSEMSGLPREVGEFEPTIALDGGVDGLDIFRRLLSQAKALLKPGGLLAVELYETKLEVAQKLAEAAEFKTVQIHPDLTDRPRFLTAIA